MLPQRSHCNGSEGVWKHKGFNVWSNPEETKTVGPDLCIIVNTSHQPTEGGEVLAWDLAPNPDNEIQQGKKKPSHLTVTVFQQICQRDHSVLATQATVVMNGWRLDLSHYLTLSEANSMEHSPNVKVKSMAVFRRITVGWVLLHQ